MSSRRTQRKKPQHAAMSLILLICGIAAVLAMIVLTAKERMRGNSIATEIERMQQEVAHIEGNNALLKEQIDFLESSEFREREAKEKLHMQKEGERIMIVRTAPESEEVVEAEPVGTGPGEPRWRSWWRVFFE